MGCAISPQHIDPCAREAVRDLPRGGSRLGCPPEAARAADDRERGRRVCEPHGRSEQGNFPAVLSPFASFLVCLLSPPPLSSGSSAGGSLELELISRRHPHSSTVSYSGSFSTSPTRKPPTLSRPLVRPSMLNLRFTAGVGVGISGACGPPLVWRARNPLPSALRSLAALALGLARQRAPVPEHRTLPVLGL